MMSHGSKDYKVLEVWESVTIDRAGMITLFAYGLGIFCKIWLKGLICLFKAFGKRGYALGHLLIMQHEIFNKANGIKQGTSISKNHVWKVH